MATVTALGRRAGTSSTVRTREQITSLFDGWDLVRPGVTWTAAWRPEPPEAWEPRELAAPDRANLLAGVARKPAPATVVGARPVERA
jgi:hypothetical protein